MAAARSTPKRREVLRAMVAVTQDGGVVIASPERFAELAIALHDYVIDQRGGDVQQGHGGTVVDLQRMAEIIRIGSR